MWLGKLTMLDMTPLGWLGRKTSIQTNLKETMSFRPAPMGLTCWLQSSSFNNILKIPQIFWDSCEALLSSIMNTGMQEYISHQAKIWLWVIRRQWRPRSDCADAQSDQGLHWLLTEPLDTIECLNGEQRPGWYSAHTQGVSWVWPFLYYKVSLAP